VTPPCDAGEESVQSTSARRWPPSSAHSGRNGGGRTIEPALRVEPHSRASQKTNLRLRTNSARAAAWSKSPLVLERRVSWLSGRSYGVMTVLPFGLDARFVAAYGP
jgi:hypothetical protein